MIDNCTPHCPRCGRPSATPSAANLKAYYCHHCKMEFEDGDDGDIGYRMPETNAMRREGRLKKSNFTSGGDERKAVHLRGELRRASKR